MQATEQRKARVRMVRIVLVVYLVSFCLPAWYDGSRTAYGWEAFLWGCASVFFALMALIAIPFALLSGQEVTTRDWLQLVVFVAAGLSWLANVLLWGGLFSLLTKSRRATIVLGLLALGMAGSFWGVCQFHQELSIG